MSSESTPPSIIMPTVTTEANVSVTWQGNNECYELLYYKYGDYNTDTIKNISGITQNLLDLPDGVYEFWVRGVNPTTSEMTSWSFSEPLLVYDSSTCCIDYMNLDAATCRTLRIPYGNPITPNYETDSCITKTVGKVDYGFRSNRSQHTLHYLPEEKDPNTNYQLTTTPPDGSELAAVRLGNSYVTAPAGGAAIYSEGADITYRISVENNQILLLKYAAVLMQPDDVVHTETGKPRFVMQIYDEYGLKIGQCGLVDLSAGVNTEEWHITQQPDVNGIIRNVYYNDWTTLGINLSDYAGQDIYVRLMTSDCNLSGHYGYAYFTLDCQEAVIENVSLEEGAGSAVSAPAGFNYEWFPKYPDDNQIWQSYNNGNEIVCTERIFFPYVYDTCTYTCRLTSLEHEACQLELDVNVRLNKQPHSAFTVSYIPDSCINWVQVSNNSYVSGNGSFNQKPETFCWDFGEGAEPRISASSEDVIWVKYPQEGGMKEISLRTGTHNDRYVDSISHSIFVPAIGDKDTTVLETIYMPNEEVSIMGHVFYGEVDTTLHFQSLAGCDSVLHVIITQEMNSEVQNVSISGKDYIEIREGKVMNPNMYTIVVYDIAGKAIYRGKEEEIVMPMHGIYILQVNGSIYKVVL